MILAIPVIMTGSFAVMFNNIPVSAYKEFIQTFAGGILSNVMHFGVVAEYVETLSQKKHYIL